MNTQDKHERNRVLIFVKKRSEFSNFRPEDGSYSAYMNLRSELGRLWAALSKEEQEEARTLLKYKSIKV